MSLAEKFEARVDRLVADHSTTRIRKISYLTLFMLLLCTALLIWAGQFQVTHIDKDGTKTNTKVWKIMLGN